MMKKHSTFIYGEFATIKSQTEMNKLYCRIYGCLDKKEQPTF